MKSRRLVRLWTHRCVSNKIIRSGHFAWHSRQKASRTWKEKLVCGTKWIWREQKKENICRLNWTINGMDEMHRNVWLQFHYVYVCRCINTICLCVAVEGRQEWMSMGVCVCMCARVECVFWQIVSYSMSQTEATARRLMVANENVLQLRRFALREMNGMHDVDIIHVGVPFLGFSFATYYVFSLFCHFFSIHTCTHTYFLLRCWFVCFIDPRHTEYVHLFVQYYHYYDCYYHSVIHDGGAAFGDWLAAFGVQRSSVDVAFVANRKKWHSKIQMQFSCRYFTNYVSASEGTVQPKPRPTIRCNFPPNT